MRGPVREEESKGYIVRALTQRFGRPSAQSLSVLASSATLLIFVTAVDSFSQLELALEGMYLVVPMYVALRFRSRVFYPVLALAVLGFLAQFIVTDHGHPLSVVNAAALAVKVTIELTAFAIMAYLVSALNLVHAKSMTDPLTGVLNRFGMEARLPALVRASRAKHLPITAIAFDVDHFKQLNDTRGHEAGDEVLRRIGAKLQTLQGPRGLAVRTGGDEFFLFLVEPRSVAMVLTEMLRSSLQAEFRSVGLGVTLSAGIVSSDEPGVVVEDLVRLADRRLYAQKWSREAVYAECEQISAR